MMQEEERVGKVLTVPLAAAMLHISPSTVYDMCRRRALPHVRLGGRVLLLEDDLWRWLKETAITPSVLASITIKRRRAR